MKEIELRKHLTCSICNQKVGASGLPMFWTVSVKRHALNMGAIKRQSGLAMFLGNAALANVMGADEDMTELICDYEITICETCAGEKRFNLFELAELNEFKKEEN